MIPLAFSVLLLLIGIAHLHPGTDFTVPYIPSPTRVIHYVAPALHDTENRQLDRAQCLDRYPNLYYEADRAKRWFSGGISEEMVDEAEKDGASARLAIINNRVSRSPPCSGLGAEGSYT